MRKRRATSARPVTRADLVVTVRIVGAGARMPLLARRIDMLRRVFVRLAIARRYFKQGGQQLLDPQQGGKNFLIHSKKPHGVSMGLRILRKRRGLGRLNPVRFHFPSTFACLTARRSPSEKLPFPSCFARSIVSRSRYARTGCPPAPMASAGFPVFMPRSKYPPYWNHHIYGR